MRSLALEDSSIRVLNFAPGPIDTEMQVEARTKTADEEIREMFIGINEALYCYALLLILKHQFKEFSKVIVLSSLLFIFVESNPRMK